MKVGENRQNGKYGSPYDTCRKTVERRKNNSRKQNRNKK